MAMGEGAGIAASMLLGYGGDDAQLQAMNPVRVSVVM